MRLDELPLLADADAESVGHLADRLDRLAVPAGQPLLREGDVADFFAIILAGSAVATRQEPEGIVEIAELDAGDVVGELGLLLRRPRLATITARTTLEALAGDVAAFELLLDTPGVYGRVERLVSRRLAEDVRPIPVTLPDATPVWFRPLLRSDRDAHHDAVRAASTESLRRRFFTAGPVSQRVLDYLVDIDFIDHFAWVCVDHLGEGIGVVRYIRDSDRADVAEFAFSVRDDWQGRGVGTLLLGAVAVAADAGGIRELTASFLEENEPVWSLLNRLDATFEREEPGVMQAAFPVDGAMGLLAPEAVSALRAAVGNVVDAAGLALGAGGEQRRGPPSGTT